MRALTLRNLPADVVAAIENTAREQGSSLARAALQLLAKGAGLTRPGTRSRRQHHLDRFHGTWTAEEANELDAALAEQRRIDPELWR